MSMPCPLPYRLAAALAGVLAGAAGGAEAPAAARPWPLWDGSESIEQYAKRAGMEPTKTLDLGNGIKMELVLIPAGKFTMGTEKPTPVDEQGFREKIVVGRAALAVGAGVLLVLLGTVVVRAIRRRGRPQYSLARFVAMIVVAGVGVLGGTHWWESARILAEAKAEYQAAWARFKKSYDWEKPAHEVTLSTPYYIGRCEVTQEQYQQVMGNNPSYFKGRDLPVEQVSWEDAQEFCKKTSEKTGWVVRLPTEAEWEHACRAGTKTTYCTGDAEADLDRATWYGKNGGNTTHPAGQKAQNAWGVHDMHGNVWEWCADRYADYGTGAVTDPQGPADGAGRVLRGGSWLGDPGYCRSARRLGRDPGDRFGDFGFRVVGSLPRTP
jgi:formylglycine-generating enzyme required for sulfatase activity